MKWIAVLMSLLLLAGCNFPLLQTDEPTSPPASQPVSGGTQIPSPAPDVPRGTAEAIAILEPGPGSRLTSPVHIAGVADGTFEQTLAIRIVLDDGSLLAEAVTTIEGDMGERGPYAADVPFSLEGERNALIQVYDVSARDGGILHLNSVGVILMEDGEVDVRDASAEPEAIVIERPAMGERISGGMVHVEGIGIASFEGTLVVEVYDAAGNKVGEQPLIVDAPDMGQPGSFSVDVAYAVVEEGPGRIVVVDPLPAFDGIGHIASVEVILVP
jgi:hypothetical protein